MVTVLDLNSESAAVEFGARGNGMWSAAGEQKPVRRVDCSAMARMQLPALLYYVLAGDGKRLAASS
jgi:hypothetical protein